MRIANVNGRLTVVPAAIATIAVSGQVLGLDVQTASDGRFGSDPREVFAHWDEFAHWAAGAPLESADVVIRPEDLGPVSPMPAQVFAIGLNYAAHAAESHLEAPSSPATFTKFPTCLAGPFVTVSLPRGSVDWEVELVVIMGRLTRNVTSEEAWSCVAGLAVGQDFSERELQRVGPAPQFSLAKSFPRFGPFGPALVTVDEFSDPDDLAIECAIDGESVQSARTSQMVFGVPALIAHLSSVLTLLPGDVIFTGTPAGVGMGRTPPRYLRAGEVVESTIEGIGTLRNLVGD
jgi:2-keto-4-pentenoate hydratase/2-oxohepta-3-ene-1,7-dioic acid hydratase in catechol pathway